MSSVIASNPVSENSAQSANVYQSIKILPGLHSAIIGMTGSGKSELSKRLVVNTSRLCVIDSKGEYELPGLPVYSDVRRIKRDKPDRFIYRPTAGNFSNLQMYDELLEWVFNRPPFRVCLDELRGIMQGKKFPHHLEVIYCMGRSRNVCCTGTFQRPSALPLFMLSEATQFYAFRLTLADDIKRVSTFVPGYSADLFQRSDVTPYTFAYKNVKDQKPLRLIELDLSQGKK